MGLFNSCVHQEPRAVLPLGHLGLQFVGTFLSKQINFTGLLVQLFHVFLSLPNINSC